MAVTLPIKSVTMPSTLNGKQNGKLPPETLAQIGVGSARMETTSARAFRAMFAAARAANFNIRHVGDYRSFDAQVKLFVSRYEPVPFSKYAVTPPSRCKRWTDAAAYGYSSTYWIKKLINGKYPATAATPGKSNHGWGLALDIAEELDGDSGPESITPRFVDWLILNADRYGICAELQSEPWHWRYYAGDRIPQAVRDFEAGNSVLHFAYPGTPVQLGSRGDAAKLVQAVIGAVVDGNFGPQSVEALKEWQRSRGLTPDGICGSTTWQKMFG